MCGLHRSRDQGGGGPNGQIVGVKRAADERRQRSREIIDEKKEKYRAKNGSLRNSSTDSKGTAFVILINEASAPIEKERLSPTSKELGSSEEREEVESSEKDKPWRTKIMTSPQACVATEERECQTGRGCDQIAEQRI